MLDVRVRFAPSPTGPLHIGGLRTALYNYLFAKKHEGSFILRIEDTDRERFVEGAEDYIVNALSWCGLTIDEGPGTAGRYGPYRQSERLDIYKKYVAQLLDRGQAYYAFDTKEELEAMRQREANQGRPHAKYDAFVRRSMRNSLSLGDGQTSELIQQGAPHVIRLRVPDDKRISFSDHIRGEVVIHTKELDDKVLLKADGYPTYHLANVVDDHLMKISHVIRGEEWLSSTAHHVLLYQAFGWENSMPKFAHLPLILKPSGKGKLSKRDGQKFGFPVFPISWTDPDPQASFPGFDTAGFIPDALINFLSFLGWNPGTEQEIFSLEQLISAFSLDNIGKAGARFDYEKALWYNAQYMTAQDKSRTTEMVKPFMIAAGYDLSMYHLQDIVELMEGRVNTLADFPVAVQFLYDPNLEYDKKTIKKKWHQPFSTHYRNVVKELKTMDTFDAVSIKEHIRQYINEAGIKFGDLMPLLRIGLTGATKGPDLFMTMQILGSDKATDRLSKAMVSFDKVMDNH